MNIYWDLDNHVFVKSLTYGQELSRIDLILRDLVPVTLYLCRPSSTDQSYVAEAAPSGYSVKFGLKLSTALSGGYLAFQGTWTGSGSGASSKYAADIDLNTVELIANMAASAYVDYTAEFTLQDAAGVNKDSSQITMRVTADVIRAGGATPTAGDSWPWIEEFTVSGRKCVRISNSDGEVLAQYAPPGVTIP